jgi:WD40 repeat protein
VVHELRNQKEPGAKTSQPAAPATGSSFNEGDSKRDGEPNLVDFDPSGLKLDPGGKVMAMSFDAQGRTLIVGFEDRSQLVTLGLGPDRSFKKSTNYGKPIRGWALSAGGKLAVATELQIYLVDLISLREGREKDPRPLASGQMTPHLKCVAFGPKGTTLATGDENGNVSIRLLGTPFEGREVLRLAHVGPVTKVGFSPDGRILAALARPVDMRGDSEGGVIRLWVNENWEPGDSDKWGVLLGPGAEGRN